MITGTDVIEYVNASAGDLAYAETCAAVAMERVDDFITLSLLDTVPETVYNRAALVTAAEMFEQRNAPNGIRQFAAEGFAGEGMRVSRDPMAGAYPLLRPYLPGGFA